GVKVGLESLDSKSQLAGGAGTSNVIQFKTENYTDPPLIIQGPGAGPGVTAGGVLSEINSLTRGY
ncbi:homoserine dehydrogenase, partial [Candidatus Bipolaricaulota bacterium]|nr:homoserine dehydrogenase [Candidatus Bipolaricaulota bacterium]